jgi:hypothetical protein
MFSHDPRPDADVGEQRPWEQPGAVRRDCAPHRGHVLALLAWLSVACGVLSFCLVVPGLPGLAFGAGTWVLAAGDLARMRQGRMDRAGRPATEAAQECGLLGGLLSLGGWALWAMLLLLPYPALPR